MGDGAFETLTGSVDPALVVVTTAADGERAGCVVGFQSQASMDPHHYCVWLSKANHTYRVALRASHFVVHFLTAQDLVVAELFGTRTGDDVDKFAGLEVETGPNDVPLLAACPNRMVVERLSILDDGGDHVCLVTRVVSAETAGTFTPLRVSDAAELTPGHDNTDRALDPSR